MICLFCWVLFALLVSSALSSHEEGILTEGFVKTETVGERSSDCFKSSETYPAGAVLSIMTETDSPSCSEAGVFVFASVGDCYCGTLPSCPSEFTGTSISDRRSLGPSDKSNMGVKIPERESLFVTIVGKTVQYCQTESTKYSVVLRRGESSAVVIGVVLGGTAGILICVIAGIAILVIVVLAVVRKQNADSSYHALVNDSAGGSGTVTVATPAVAMVPSGQQQQQQQQQQQHVGVGVSQEGVQQQQQDHQSTSSKETSLLWKGS